MCKENRMVEVEIEPQKYIRPKTRGDLLDMLNLGYKCEVAEYVSEMTEVMLKGWLNYKRFETYPSENLGWTVFDPYTNN